jgi:diphthamide biosynthesis methyltransferase
MNLTDEIRQLEQLIAAEPDPAKRQELEQRFAELMQQAQQEIHRLPSFQVFKALFNNQLN